MGTVTYQRYPPCGFKSFCGRPQNHRGHHGGWRTGVQIIVPERIRHISYNGSPYTPGEMIPARSLQVVGEYITHGSFKGVADCLGVSLQTVKNHASAAIATTGAASTSNAAYKLGWVLLPNGIGHPDDFEEWEGSGI